MNRIGFHSMQRAVSKEDGRKIPGFLSKEINQATMRESMPGTPAFFVSATQVYELSFYSPSAVLYAQL
jgi:hypothetical protein